MKRCSSCDCLLYSLEPASVQELCCECTPPEPFDYGGARRFRLWAGADHERFGEVQRGTGYLAELFCGCVYLSTGEGERTVWSCPEPTFHELFEVVPEADEP